MNYDERSCSIGKTMHEWVVDLFRVNRSLTGPGVRETLSYIKKILPSLEIKSVPTGYQAFDWIVPEEWLVTEAYIEDKDGIRLVDFKVNNLHLVGYSVSVDEWLTFDGLNEHLYSLPDQPDAIPYITSYYSKRWGFCLTHNQRQLLNKDGKYHVVIKSEHKQGVLNYAELVLPGTSKEEVFISTYVCHPSMANNELSGPVVTTALAQWLMELKDRRYTYRFVFIPETIGSIVYISKNLKHLKERVFAGFNVTCIGDDRCYSYLPSRAGNTYSDKIAQHVLRHTDPDYKKYSWLDRGSDERQYCAPGIDLPIATIMRSKYGEYPEYHTSLDNLELVTPTGLEGGFYALRKALEAIEKNIIPQVTVLGEPQLGKRGLYPSVSTKSPSSATRILMDLITYCDGKHTLLDIANLTDQPIIELWHLLEQLKEHNLVKIRRKI